MKQINEQGIEEHVKGMTLEEKVRMIHGNGIFKTGEVERFGIPPLYTSDGPMGVRKEFMNDMWRDAGDTEDYVSYLPSNTALASTWNKDLSKKTGHVLGEEARGRGKDVILAPGINIQRSPLCGRNFEYMSEDPKLIEEMAVPLIEGIQDGTDVAACVKHFAVNAQETARLSVDTHVSERALREIYFPGFKAAVQKAGSHTLMGAYNKLHGEFCSHSKTLLNGVLREEWGYDGVVISDWGAVHDTREAAESGLDIEMSVTNHFDDYYMANPLINLVQKGEIDEAYIDEKVRNILRLMFRLNMIGENKEKRNAGTYNKPEHREAVLETARESIVLLKNDNNCLPIKKNRKNIAVIGQNAMRIHSNGGGSAEIKALYEISPLMGLKKQLGGNVSISYAKGYYTSNDVTDVDVDESNWQEISLTTFAEGEKENVRNPQIDILKKKYMDEAVSIAKTSDEVIFIGGLDHDYDVEGKDREDMKLPYGQDDLIRELLKVNSNMAVVIMAGAPVEMEWADDVKAIVWYSYAGMEGGTALAEVLTGAVNPSGKLPMTFPMVLSDSPAHKIGEFGNESTVTFKEDIFVGYRYYDTYGVKPRFPFGHGLSYTQFAYDDFELEYEEEIERDDTEHIYDGTEFVLPFEVRVDVTVKNIGLVAGHEILQVYVADLTSSVKRPIKELKGFDKVFLQAGEEKVVSVVLAYDAFGFYNEEKQCFEAEAGEFEILIGCSSEELYESAVVELETGYYYK